MSARIVHPTLRARVLARLHGDDRGFSLLEVVVALLLLFSLLVALESAAVAGFRYIGFGRERQAANQIANQLMEETRALAYSKIQRGVQTSDLSGDPNIVTNCPLDLTQPTYRYLSCSGEKVVTTASNCPTTSSDCVVPLVPNSGTCPGTGVPLCSTSSYPVTYSWRTYVLNETPAGSPFRVLAIVSWTSKSVPSTVTQQVKLESLYWSPTGCGTSSLDVHPFAIPCSAFFYGQGQMSKGTITVAGTVGGTNFQSAVLTMPKLDVALQQEQVAQIQGSVSETGTSVVDGAGTHAGGSTTAQTSAVDGDPANTTPSYQTASLTGAGYSWTTSAGSDSITNSNAASDAGAVNAAIYAGGTNVCPPPTTTAETDNLPCGGARVTQAGNLRSAGSLGGSNPSVGAITVVNLAAPGAASTAIADRDPVTGQDGIAQLSVSRTIGRLDIGSLPAGITSPPAGWGGYFVSLTNYSDSTIATAGSSAAAPTAAIGGAATLSYWNGTGYTNVTLSSDPTYTFPGGWTQTVSQSFPGNKSVSATLTAVGTIGMSSQPSTSSTPAGGGTILRNDVTAALGSPLYGQFTYRVARNGTTVANLTITIDLGTTYAHSVYTAAPTA